jgi:hypothetical protein
MRPSWRTLLILADLLQQQIELLREQLAREAAGGDV